MKFSTRDRYALRLMVELANRPNDLIPLKEISDKQRISLKYLEQIVTPLAKAGLVSSERGAQGGYRLARSAAEITSGEILRAVEGELTAIPCLASSVDCPHRGQCHTLDFWSGLNDLINKYVDGITLEQLRTMPEVPEISPETSETSETDLYVLPCRGRACPTRMCKAPTACGKAAGSTCAAPTTLPCL